MNEYSSKGLHDLRSPKIPTVLKTTARIIHTTYNNQHVEEVALSMQAQKFSIQSPIFGINL